MCIQLLLTFLRFLLCIGILSKCFKGGLCVGVFLFFKELFCRCIRFLICGLFLSGQLCCLRLRSAVRCISIIVKRCERFNRRVVISICQQLFGGLIVRPVLSFLRRLLLLLLCGNHLRCGIRVIAKCRKGGNGLVKFAVFQQLLR